MQNIEIFVAVLSIWILVLDGTRGQQQFRRRTSNVCHVDEDCPQSAYCEHNPRSTPNGFCSCYEGYFILSENRTRECFKVSTAIGDYCIYDEQCQLRLSTDAECRLNTCQCKPGTHHVEKENTCYRTSLIGEYCRLTNNCIGDDTSCRFGVCVCPVDKHQNAENTACLNDVQLGQLCNRHDECVAAHSRCHNICRCLSSHTLSLSGRRCLPIAGKLSDVCEEDIQCLTNIPYSTCAIEKGVSNGTCTCIDNHHEINYRCYTSVPLKGICEIDQNCAIVPGAECNGGRCQCKYEFLEVDGQCASSNKLQLCYYILFLAFVVIKLF